MKRFASVLALSLAGFLSPAASASAANLDHLLCYRMKDPLQLESKVDLAAELQPEFSKSGCVIIKPIEFCVPVTKLNVQPPPALPNLSGQPLRDDYICYLAKCPLDPRPANRIVADQFGQREQRRYQPVKLCVPAKKGPRPCGTAGARRCAGACPNPGEQCVPDPLDAGCVCMPNSPPCEGRPDKAGMCGGSCPLTTDRCMPGADGKCTCQPPPPPPCGINAATGTCGGECPNATDKCLIDTAGVCSCVPLQTPCSLIPGANACGGNCPNPTDTCTFISGTCVCQPQDCVRNSTTGQCGGNCPQTDQKCLLDAATNECSCQRPPCGSDPVAGTCGGACPTGTTCKLNAATNSCGCSN